VEIFQPLVRHGSRSRRLAVQQHSVLRHGGLAFGELRATTFGLSESHTNAGWTLGAGAEMGFAQNWSAKIEYLYVDLANSNFVVTGASNGYRFGLIRAGVNYRF
jgi:outer membrane immunogenic protein